MFAQAVPCSCAGDATLVLTDFSRFVFLSMLTGHHIAGMRVPAEDESRHEGYQPAGGALLGVSTAHAALLSSPGLHHH